jgi:multisubunit Na+/H+ antiporter MnhB subunit
MSDSTATPATGMEWKWVLAGVFAGLIIVGASYYIVAPVFHSPAIQTLVMMVGFSMTGVIVGYFSPGVTIREAGIAGAIVMVLIMLLMAIAGDPENFVADKLVDFLLLLLGIGFSLAGAWAGEKLQGGDTSATDEDKAEDVIHWKWVLTGVVVGFALSALFVFLTFPIHKSMIATLVAFLFSFLIAGFIVGYKSPGVTLKEPAIAGIFTVIVDWVFLEFGISLSITADNLISGLALGFLFSLLGAWLGEKYQESRQAGTTE